MVLDPDATEVKFASYYTGNHVDGGTSRFDPQGKIYQAVCSCGFLADGVMATTPNAYSTAQYTACDIGVFKIDFESEGVNSVANFVVDNNDWCQPVEVNFENLSNGMSYLWDFGNDSLSTETNPSYTYEQAGNYTVSLVSIDSTTCNISDTAFFELNVLETSNGIQQQTSCDSFTWIDGNTYTSSNNTATHILANSVGCDSLVTLDLTILNSSTGTDTQIHCDSYTWIDGNTYTSSNNTATHILTNSVGCDSLVTLDLTILNSNAGVDSQTHCDSYTWIDGNTYTSSNNTATHMLTNSVGCDSLVTLDLIILNSSSGTDVQIHCDSYTWIDGNTYTSSNNIASHILTNSVGCDSLVTLDLTILNSSSTTDTQIHCDSYTWIDGNTYTSSTNTPSLVFTNSVGCDSVITLNLTILNSTSGTDAQTHCDSYTWIDGNTYTSSNNTATHILTNSVGCDSLVTLDLTILNSSTGTDTQTHCDTYTWIDGNTYTSSNNTATHMLTNSVGCDSLVTLDLIILNSSSGTDVQIHCDNYTWIDGNTYTSSNNIASHILTNSVGCDSLVTLDLTILNSSTGTDTQIHCDSYTWIDGNTYTSSTNTPSLVFTNSVGCDSVITLNLTILNSTSGTDTQTHCDSYTWIDGNTYTSSNNTATHILTNSVGCDSVVTLDLFINNSNTGTDAIIHCNSYTWIDGNTYTSSNNTATHTLTNSQGCDSIVSLDLTILYSSTEIDTQIHCNEYTWINGRTYTSSNNTATITLNNSVGCDSIVTLNLIINYSDSIIESHQACQRFYWSINGVEYSQSGSYIVDSVNDFGCSYFARLDLEIFEPTFIDDYVSSCGRYYWQKSGDYYQQSGVYTTKIDGAPLCDTTATLHLNIESNSFFIPNTFTPNEDRKNEVFKMYSKNTIQNFEMWVFNRWGQLYYSTDINTGWNGMFKGQMSAIGVYAYMFKFNCSDESFVEVGTFTLIR